MGMREGTCGACKYFDYKGDDEKGHCNWYGQYYWPNDRTCSHYELDMSSGSGGCHSLSPCTGTFSAPGRCP